MSIQQELADLKEKEKELQEELERAQRLTAGQLDLLRRFISTTEDPSEIKGAVKFYFFYWNSTDRALQVARMQIDRLKQALTQGEEKT